MSEMVALMDLEELAKEGNGVAFVKSINSKAYSDMCDDVWSDYQEWHRYWDDYH